MNEREAAKTAQEAAKRSGIERHREVQRERQKAYRQRLRERGLYEIRLRIAPEHHDRLRAVADALEAGGLNDRLLAGGERWRLADIGRLLRSPVGLGIIAIGCMAGALIGAAARFEIQTDNLRQAQTLVPDLRREVTRLTASNRALREDVGRARNSARRATEDLTAIRSALTALNVDIGGLRQDVTRLTDKKRQAGRVGPKLVPERAAESRMFGPPLPEAMQARPTLAAYQFQLGDTLESVTRRFGVSVDEITRVNARLRQPPWRLGDMIVVPVSGSLKPARSALE